MLAVVILAHLGLVVYKPALIKQYVWRQTVLAARLCSDHQKTWRTHPVGLHLR